MKVYMLVSAGVYDGDYVMSVSLSKTKFSRIIRTQKQTWLYTRDWPSKFNSRYRIRVRDLDLETNEIIFSKNPWSSGDDDFVINKETGELYKVTKYQINPSTNEITILEKEKVK